jgi:hypothetical protein
MLEGYDLVKAHYLVDGFMFGFSLDFQGPSLNNRSSNLVSASQRPQVVGQKLAREIALGRVVGPFSTPPPPFSPDFNVSPIGLQPKKIPGDFRLIHHLSHPPGNSVNFFIPQELSSVQYTPISAAISSIQAMGRGCFLAKSDIKSAFRLIPLHPSVYPLLGMSWQGKYYFDRCLPMGASSSCAIFECFSTALQWLVSQEISDCHVHHVLDDFIFISSSRRSCLLGLQHFQSICALLGVPLAPDKTVGPSQVLTFLGIELDTSASEARLPQDKLDKCLLLISQTLSSKSLKLKSLQSIIGTLNFACSVVLPGRAFLRRLIQLLIGKKKPNHHISLSAGAKSDMRTWKAFLDHFNGKSFFLQQRWATSISLQLYTDAAASLGYGAIFGQAWFYGEWPNLWKAYSITILEFYPILVAVETWASRMSNRCILFYTDNQAVVSIINSQTCKDTKVMLLMRRLVLTCLKHNILFQAKHVPGVNNTLPDLLSRLKLSQFKAAAGCHMDQSATQVPMPPPELL